MSQTSSPHYVPPPRRKACDACSKAKVRCDQKAGYCSRCAVRGIECVYPSGRLVGVPQYLQTYYTSSPGAAGPSSSTAQAFAGVQFNAYPAQTGVHGQALSTEQLGRSLWDISAAESKKEQDPIGESLATDFADALLVCNINAAAIQNRWLKAFIPEPDQRPKVPPAAINAYVGRLLKAYTGSIIRHGHLPPFVHARQVDGKASSSPLISCFGLLKLCSIDPRSDKVMVLQLLEQEMSRIYELRATFDHLSLLEAFQAYLIYVMAIHFNLAQENHPLQHQFMLNLQQLASDTCSQGITCAAELDHTRPQWPSWIIAEAKRRALYIMYLFDNMLCAKDNIPIFVGTELRGLLAPTGKHLWGASSEDAWKTAYNLHLADWIDSGLLLDELWQPARNTALKDLAERRERIDRWLEDADEYCTMLYAVTSCTHGE